MDLELTGAAFAGVVVASAVVLPVLALVLWSRLRGPSWARLGQRWGLVVLAQVAAVLAVLVLVNDSYGLYASWADLLGRDAQGLPATVDLGGGGHGASTGAAAAAPWVDGRPAGFSPYEDAYVARVAVPGTTATANVFVWLPPQYQQPAFAHHVFPVVELFHGYPGTPTTWLHAMAVRQRFEQAMAAGVPPAVLVMPQISLTGAPDLECADVPGQPQMRTFLTQVVPRVVQSRFRVGLSRWGAVGYSEGGYCAAALVLGDPSRYVAGVDLSGYDSPESTLFSGYPALRKDLSLSRLLASRPQVSLLATASIQDPQSAGSLALLTRDVRPPTVVQTITLPRGGHNTQDWSAQLPGAFAWLAQHLR